MTLDWYPTISFRIGKSSWDDSEFRTNGKVIIADFDTGTPGLWISDRLLSEFGIHKSVLNFRQTGEMFGQRFGFYTIKLKVALIGMSGETEPVEIPTHVVEDFEGSPFTERNPARRALAGRGLIQPFNATVELDSPNKVTRVILQDWQGFEKEVANLYRALGLSVRRNVNLAGNQIDVLLEEKTSSGKNLRTIVECKFYQKPVGIQQVRELASVFDFIRTSGLAEHAVLVASAGFTKDAHLVANTTGIELLEIEDLRARGTNQGRVSIETEPMRPGSEKPDSREQKTAFVMMPFSDEFRDIYMLGIREPLAERGYVCVRADETEFSGRIMDKVLDLIKGSDVIVAEVTEHNANVYYELGIAHATGKTVVLCTRDISRAPFDLRDQNHIVYKSIVDLREKLDRRLESLIQVTG